MTIFEFATQTCKLFATDDEEITYSEVYNRIRDFVTKAQRPLPFFTEDGINNLWDKNIGVWKILNHKINEDLTISLYHYTNDVEDDIDQFSGKYDFDIFYKKHLFSSALVDTIQDINDRIYYALSYNFDNFLIEKNSEEYKLTAKNCSDYFDSL